MAEESGCADCRFRKKYDDNPRSLLGRLWRWHAGWCPGWRKYLAGLPADEQVALRERYRLKR